MDSSLPWEARRFNTLSSRLRPESAGTIAMTTRRTVATVLLVVMAMVPADSGLSLEERVLKRLASQGKEESMEMRGYDRMTNHPQYLLFGAGEGAYYRFQSAWPRELHSSYGTLLFCYGIFGTALFT